MALLVISAASGCAPRTLLERAIRARGGPLPALVRDVEATVTAPATYPGTWQATATFQRPERFAWSVDTFGQPNHYLFDGDVVRAFIGTALVSTDADPAAPLRTHARFTAVMQLDVLTGTGIVLEELRPDSRPDGAAFGLLVRFPDGPEFRLGFDGRERLVSVEGPLDLPGIGVRRVRADLSEFATIDGWVLPRRVRYRADDRVVMDERVRTLCPDPPGLTIDAFRDPTRLPPCR